MATIVNLGLKDGPRIDRGHSPNCLGSFEEYPEGDCPNCKVSEFCKTTKALKDQGEAEEKDLSYWIYGFYEIFGRYPSIPEFASAFKACDIQLEERCKL
jgi:hypothetical protein